MSWFNKLFNLILGEDEDDKEQVKYIEKQYNVRPVFQENEEMPRIPDAKVVYKYPKGNFRFPMIPDQNTNKKKSREQQTKRRVNNNYSSHSQHANFTKNEAEFTKKPFRPTVIPSPVYGFHEQKRVQPASPLKHKVDNVRGEMENRDSSLSEEVKSINITEPTEIHLTSSEDNQKRMRLIEEDDDFQKQHTEDTTNIEPFAETESAGETAIDRQSESDNPSLLEHDLQQSDLENKSELLLDVSENEHEQKQVQQDSNSHVSDQIVNEPTSKMSGSSQKQQQKNYSSRVPFNVMMLSADKQNNKAPQSYQFPSLSLLDVPPAQRQDDHAWIQKQKDLLDETLENFNVKANVVHVTYGPSVTRFEVHPEPGVKVNKITNLSDDIKLSLSAKDIRIEAPIPGKNTVGIEVPNLHSKMVYLREMIRSPEFRTSQSPLTSALGLDISGQPIVLDLKKMPHGLIAGATGSGKSVCINTVLVSLLYKAAPSEVKLLLIDPKMVELAPYNQIPHLVSPVITDAKAATAALKWVVEEMERRYELFAHARVRDIERFNETVHEKKMGEKLPYLVVVIDELADLMMVAPNEVEESICRIAQKARACGIHLLIATQRPSVDVITGLIKANIPTRIAFSVSSGVDSRTIIDMSGAEKLLGKGDMLFLENGSGKPVRLQGNFVSDYEIDRVVSHVKQQQKPVYLFEQEELIRQNPAGLEQDELFPEALTFAVEQNSASTSSLQRRFRIGYNRAARLIDMMEGKGFISEAKGSKPREVLISRAELEHLIESGSFFS
ncbi:DNA translocase FtsK [Bacillus sp. CLL-7-23]|uniref:DNA translocase FtsK n=1 Tax=Bacillus changyiensis TaxID=3004103 RepID=A0ABT4X4T3_9BACI|nr:DNA translocase FtsK [Bacillus changyiensis]MDA7027271.1 DNA translocase FtsK [Bacillus changyiensis]